MNSRIRHLELNVAVYDGDREYIQGVRRTVEDTFVPGVLEALERETHLRFGAESILRIRELHVQWGLEHDQLNDGQYPERLGQELADRVEFELRSRSMSDQLRPSPLYSIVLFENETHLQSAYLSDHVESKGGAWFYRGVVSGNDVWSELCRAGSATLKASLAYLDRMGMLESIASHLDATQLSHARDVLPLKDWPGEAVQRIGLTTKQKTQSSHSEDCHPAPQMTDFPSEEALPSTEPEFLTPILSQAVQPLDIDRPQAKSRTSVQSNQEGEPVQDDYLKSPLQGQARDESWSKLELAPQATPTGLSSGHEGEGSLQQLSAPLLELIDSRFAGLFYLLKPILELDLPEILWCAGVKEGEFLCHVGRMLLGSHGATDPAPRILGGIVGELDPVLAEVPDWAAAEINAKSLKTLRVLVDRLGAPEQLDGSLEAKLEDLAHTLVPLPAQGIHDSETARTVSRCAAVIMQAFELRFGERLNRNDFIKLIRIQGLIEHGPKILIRFPMEAIEIRIRRAGLDVNPGYLPWLKREMVFVFEDQNERN